MSEPNNILPFGPNNGGKDKLSEERLLAYLEGTLSPTEQHEVEMWLAEEGMESDAIEGLQALKPEETKHTINKLKHQLHKTVKGKKHNRRPLNMNLTIWIAIVVILLLTVVAYIVIRIAK